MNIKGAILSIILLFVYGFIHAQPSEVYIKKLTGKVNLQWIDSVAISAPIQPLNWSPKKVQGFEKTTPLARQQAVLGQSWLFSEIDSNKSKPEAYEVNIPHRFGQKRNYTAGWYITNYKLDKLSGKRLVLMLNRVDLFSVVFVNGQRIGHHFGSYTPFEFDITDASVSGENVLAIFVHDRSAAVDGDKAYSQLGPEWLKSSYSQGRGDEVLKGGMDEIPVLEIRENVSVQDVFVKTSTRNGEMAIEYELAHNSSIFAESKLSFEVFKWPNGEKVNLNIADVSANNSLAESRSCKVKWSDPDLWSPDHPNLYVLRTTLKSGESTDVVETRFGFREFWVEGKNFMLNGIPTKLRGESTFRPVEISMNGYRKTFELHKNLFGSNACRIHAFMPSGDIMLAADEAGVLLINQSAIWSVNVMFYKNGGDWFLKNTEKEYEEWVRRDRNCPSVVIWDVENEMLRYNYDLHLPWVSKLPGFIKKHDNTRPFNFSGAGWFDEKQDMASLHMQEHYTRIMKDWKAKGTCPLLMGEFWVGGRMEQRIPTSLEFTSASQRYLEEAKSYEEKLLEMRYLGVSGLMPFRISLLAFPTIKNQQSNTRLQIQPENVTQKIRHGLQPVSLFFWPRQNYTAAQDTLKRELVLCNDGETEEHFEVSWFWGNKLVNSQSIQLKPTEQKRIRIEEPGLLKPDKLIALVHCNGELISTDTLLINPIQLPKIVLKKTIQVYQDEHLAGILAKNGFNSVVTTTIPAVKEDVIFIIPEQANNRELNSKKKNILEFLESGGTVLCLKQEQAPLWFPVRFQFWSANQTTPHTYAHLGWEGLHKNLFYSKIAPVLASSHPVFYGLNSSSLHLWDKYDGRVSDDVFVRPSNVDKYEPGNWRPLANGTRREHVSLAEIFYGKGILLSCQLNLIENLENIQAKCLLTNMLNYLSDKQAVRLKNKLAIKGVISPSEFTGLTGIKEAELLGASAENKDLMLAFDGASVAEIKDWAKEGGRAVVFSENISQTFEGVEVFKEDKNQYLATKVADHPILEGVASTNFMHTDSPSVKGHFKSIPGQAKILLQGFAGQNFWRSKDAGPVMIRLPHGKGEIILSTLEIRKNAKASTQEFLALLLSNSGVPIPFLTNGSADEIRIKKTVPITVDGQLNEWLEDMEDRNVTQYIHAQPVYLTSESIVEGPPEFDLNLSAINYFLWNEKALHIAGVVFGEEKTYETGIGYGSEKEYLQEIRFNNDVISISVKNRKANVLVNGVSISDELIGIAQINSKNMTDAANLQFNYILASGKITSVDHLIGETYELMIPWELLQTKLSEKSYRGIISLTSKGWTIEVPANGNSTVESRWMKLKISNN